MSINTGRMNIGRINRARTKEREIFISGTLNATVNSLVTVGRNVYEMHIMNASVGSTAILARGVLTTMRGNSAVDSFASQTAYLLIAEKMNAIGGHRSSLSRENVISGELIASIDARNILSRNIYSAGHMSSEVQAKIILSRNYYINNVRMNAILSQLASTVLFSFIDAFIDIDIPPGATLVIDSSGYAVLLDGENVIWAHSGDWPSFIRETYDVEFSTLDGSPISNDDLSRRVIYMERYL